MSKKPQKEFDMLMKASTGRNPLQMPSTTITSDYDMHISSRNDNNLKRLRKILLAWVNTFVASDVGTIHDLDVDLSDGQVLAVFVSKITGITIDTYAAVSENSKRHNLSQILQAVSQMGIESNGRWSVEGFTLVLFETIGIMNRDFASLLYLLIELARAFNCPHALPPNVSVAVIHTETIGNTKKNKTNIFKLTGDETIGSGGGKIGGSIGNFLSMSSLHESTNALSDGLSDNRNDLISALFNPDKQSELEQAIQLLCVFINNNIRNMGVEIVDLCEQMYDGVFLIVLIGSLGNFFVPLNRFVFQPSNTDEKLENVMFAFKLLESVGVSNKRWNAVDVVRKDMKMILRVMFDVFQAFNSTTNL